MKIGESVLAALGNGILSPDQGTKLLQALVAQARFIEVEELEKRISALGTGHTSWENTENVVIDK